MSKAIANGAGIDEGREAMVAANMGSSTTAISTVSEGTALKPSGLY
jgi:hypothetical protein